MSKEENNEENGEKGKKSPPKEKKTVNKFIGFFRIDTDSRWGLFPQMFSTEESAIQKIKLTHGDCDIHLTNTALPL